VIFKPTEVRQKKNDAEFRLPL